MQDHQPPFPDDCGTARVPLVPVWISRAPGSCVRSNRLVPPEDESRETETRTNPLASHLQRDMVINDMRGTCPHKCKV
ncbi:hypothetical protein SKAU_G00163710 [Synaphobranchus kaupii]|uniref:Uncharacterized protein n=1 Tax=Synaphobranchus kaupii TaxID=118154 RepID=A0A9Q1FJ55_SYNKA|nr:hypothetical protein SKAU_G00163710 [Synaphobranchus kaupii]